MGKSDTILAPQSVLVNRERLSDRRLEKAAISRATRCFCTPVPN
jgi:hypothetical protein